MKKILIVDDQVEILELLEMIFEGEGYQVKTLCQARDIETHIDLFQPELILLDVRISGLDGTQIATKLKSDPSYADIKIILISAMFDHRNNPVKNGVSCDGYIEKPFAMAHIIAIVAELIGPSQPVKVVPGDLQ